MNVTSALFLFGMCSSEHLRIQKIFHGRWALTTLKGRVFGQFYLDIETLTVHKNPHDGSNQLG